VGLHGGGGLGWSYTGVRVGLHGGVRVGLHGGVRVGLHMG
jgi:hypothetical protein